MYFVLGGSRLRLNEGGQTVFFGGGGQTADLGVVREHQRHQRRCSSPQNRAVAQCLAAEIDICLCEPPISIILG